MPSPRRVVVTGVGTISSIGADRAELARALREGRCGIGPITLFDTTGHRSSVGGEVRDFRLGDRLPASAGPFTSRTDGFGLVAAAEALEDAAWPEASRAALGIVVGGTTGGMLDAERHLAAVHRDRTAPVSFERILSHPISSTVDRIADVLGVLGPRATICTACSSGANALGIAARWIRSGRVRATLAGGADGLCLLTYSGFGSLGALDPAPCRPFDRTRRGLSLGEGAAMLLLEDLESALARGVPIYGELRGWATTAEAHHITNPMESGAAAAETLRRALADAGLAPDAIDYVNAHGTATPLNDPMEARALAEVFGPRSATLACSSTKGHIGHTLGAAGALEAVATLLAMQGGFAPPTVGLSDPDPACPLGHVIARAREMPIRFAISSSFGFGGNDTVLAFGPPDAEAPPSSHPPTRRIVVTGLGAIPEHVDAVATRAERPTDPGGPIREDLRALLKPARARRMDRLSRSATIAIGRALEDAGVDGDGRAPVGLVLGTGWGNLDGSAAFVDRVETRGARFAEPAVFPNLVASAPAGHASIYHGLRGPNLTVAALDASGDLAVVVAAAEVAGGAADVLLAGGAEDGNEIVEVIFSRGAGGGRKPRRGEGAAFLVLEDEGAAAARGARVIARLAEVAVACGHSKDGSGEIAGRAVLGVGGPRAGATVLVHAGAPATAIGAVREVLGEELTVISATDWTGRHEAAGAIAAAAAARLASSGNRPALSLGVAPGMAIACLFVPA